MQEEILCYVGVSNINTANIKDQTYDEIDESLRETAWCVFGSDHFLPSLGVPFSRPAVLKSRASKMRLAQNVPSRKKSAECFRLNRFPSCRFKELERQAEEERIRREAEAVERERRAAAAAAKAEAEAAAKGKKGGKKKKKK